MKNKIIHSTKAQATVRMLLGIFLIFSGIGNLTFMRTSFLEQVPNWIPMQANTIVLLFGMVEIILGASLLFVFKQRSNVGWIVTLFLIAVFLGNIAQLANHTYTFGLNSGLLLWVGLPFQPFLIALVLWSTEAWIERKTKIKFKNQIYVFWPQ
jgi:uncharacterized membrane protein